MKNVVIDDGENNLSDLSSLLDKLNGDFLSNEVESSLKVDKKDLAEDAASSRFIPEPLSGRYDEQVEAVWAKVLPEQPAAAIPLLAMIDVSANLASEFHNRSLKPIGFNHTEYAILSTLLMNGEGVRPSVLTGLLGKGSAGTAQALRKLEKNGFVSREENPLDKRSVNVELTEQGEVVARQLCESEARHLEAKFRGVDQQELMVLRRSLGRIIELMK